MTADLDTARALAGCEPGDVADRGPATGIILVGRDVVRLLHWEAGRTTEPERSMLELDLGDWREYAAYRCASAPSRSSTRCWRAR